MEASLFAGHGVMPRRGLVLDFGNGGERSPLQDLPVVVSLGCGSSAADDRLWLCRVLAAGGCEGQRHFVFVPCRVYGIIAPLFGCY
ncbi:unnamed protein product [Arabidopsis lyrata]|nr:unnamed protein product [Arabidopsis lyrata]